jgi:hypothetical protein
VLDCEMMKTLLEDTMGVPAENITMLLDDGETASEETLPTKDTIEVSGSICSGLNRLKAQAKMAVSHRRDSRDSPFCVHAEGT